jgi:hypothetical protein
MFLGQANVLWAWGEIEMNLVKNLPVHITQTTIFFATSISPSTLESISVFNRCTSAMQLNVSVCNENSPHTSRVENHVMSFYFPEES